MFENKAVAVRDFVQDAARLFRGIVGDGVSVVGEQIRQFGRETFVSVLFAQFAKMRFDDGGVAVFFRIAFEFPHHFKKRFPRSDGRQLAGVADKNDSGAIRQGVDQRPDHFLRHHGRFVDDDRSREIAVSSVGQFIVFAVESAQRR